MLPMATNISMISIRPTIISIENVENLIKEIISRNAHVSQTLIRVKRKKKINLNSTEFHELPRRKCYIFFLFIFFLEKCWFCLSSPDVEKHLVITIGDSFYLALSKGPINQYHILILSVTHIQSAALLSADDWHELEKFKSALRDFFASMYSKSKNCKKKNILGDDDDDDQSMSLLFVSCR